MIFQNPVTYIILELAAIAVLLYFIVRWTKEQKQWQLQQAEEKKQAEEDAFLQQLANKKRRAGK